MNEKQKRYLKKTVEADSGLLSPSEFINNVCKRDKKNAHDLIVRGFIEEVPEIVADRKYNFYRATEKGRSIFYPWYKKIWFYFKGDLRTIIVSLVTSLLITGLTIFLFK